MAKATATPSQSGQEEHKTQSLGPFLCWAVVFADIGTSIYYVPGILYGTVGKLAGFFVFLTMTVFILLTLKYVEVTYRFPQGGGVVTVAARAINSWFGALGGMFILVDYFLTAAISCLSGMLYLSVVMPAIGPQTKFLGLSITLLITLVILVLLGILNWVGVSESAKVSMVGAVITFFSDSVNFYLGILTTLLVLTAWTTNLIAKPLATIFGGSVAALGMAIALTNYRLHRGKGRIPVVVTGVEKDFPGAVLAVLVAGSSHNEAVIQSAMANQERKPVVFLYLGERTSTRKPELFRLIEPHLNDEQAREDLGRANYLAQEARVECRFIYRRREAGAIYRVWQELHPHDTIIAREQIPELQQIKAKHVDDKTIPDGQVMHLTT